jgi:signal transduction histidine kinase
LIEADRNKTEFVALVAHQLQSPLSGIHIYLEMARNGDFGELTPELDKILKDNIEVIDRLLATNETFLDVTKIDLGRVELIKSSTDLVDLSRRVVGELGPRAKQKGLSIRLETPFNQFIVKCDATYIHHALTNLVDNAVKYTESGGVTVSLLQEGQRVKIMVTDTGRGMVEKDMDRLFGVFQRGMAAVDLQAKGAGLGLYIVKQFIEAHGGRVFFSSPGAGQGSVFGFELTLDS